MAAKELQENRLTRDARDREVVAVLIWSRKASQALAHPDPYRIWQTALLHCRMSRMAPEARRLDGAAPLYVR